MHILNRILATLFMLCFQFLLKLLERIELPLRRYGKPTEEKKSDPISEGKEKANIKKKTG